VDVQGGWLPEDAASAFCMSNSSCMYRALLRIYRALLRADRVLLWIYRALLWIYRALLRLIGIFSGYIELFCGYTGLFSWMYKVAGYMETKTLQRFLHVRVIIHL